jgi:beta-N-acetylhexosaminidase
MRLLQLFSPNAPSTVLAAIDHEGGIVQRLTERHGFTTLPAARLVAAELSPDRARVLYAKSAAELAAVGFNLNLAPVVDLHDPLNPQIGHFGRSFDADPAIVTAYAESFIGGFASANVLCAPKHFPGLGHCHDDSHDDLPDITSTWSEIELKPFAQLIARGEAHVIMGGHVRLDTVENEMIPTTLSSAVTTGLLRDKLAFQGVAMTDDLDMAAVHNLMGRREAVIRAIAAGNDLLMVRNATNFDPCLPQNIVDWVNEAISKGSLSKDRIRESADRVRRLKQALANGVAVPSVPR